jgi:hypothetical protein
MVQKLCGDFLEGIYDFGFCVLKKGKRLSLAGALVLSGVFFIFSSAVYLASFERLHFGSGRCWENRIGSFLVPAFFASL